MVKTNAEVYISYFTTYYKYKKVNTGYLNTSFEKI